MLVSLADGALAGLHVFGIAIAHHFKKQTEIDLYENVVKGWCFFIWNLITNNNCKDDTSVYTLALFLG
jgi:hypothetical protein